MLIKHFTQNTYFQGNKKKPPASIPGPKRRFWWADHILMTAGSGNTLLVNAGADHNKGSVFTEVFTMSRLC